jgi:hypothetical protein
VAVWLYLAFKASQAGTSKASLRYRQAIEHGSPADIVREKFRRAVRELFTSWIAWTMAAFLFFCQTPGPEDEKMFAAMVVALYVFLPAWALCRLIRFAVCR